ncbi:MAG: hypothetical protein K6F76_05975 [Clostridiales bacterium]|nr:hypothetical protein [Clostridiales bacterium]
MNSQNKQNDPTQYIDLSREELEFILYYLQCVYNGIDRSDKKRFYFEKITFIKALLNTSVKSL